MFNAEPVAGHALRDVFFFATSTAADGRDGTFRKTKPGCIFLPFQAIQKTRDILLLNVPSPRL